MSDLKKHIEILVKKAAEAHDSADAMRFAQAALNAANALCGLSSPEVVEAAKQG
jgi:hypothetical protein